MKHWCLNLAVTVVALYLLVPDGACASISKRCQSVCSRSDGQDFCQRCRMRVPMRFGKRTDEPSGKGAVIRQREGDDEEDESKFDDSGQRALSSNDVGDDIRAESRLILDSMRNFIRDLEEWNRNFYDQ